MSFTKKSFEAFCDDIWHEVIIDYMEDNDIECENEALSKMYEEYEINWYESRGEM